MCEAIQQMRIKSRLEGERIGKELGKIDAKKSAAENLYAMGLTLDKIVQALGEPIETIKEWLKLG